MRLSRLVNCMLRRQNKPVQLLLLNIVRSFGIAGFALAFSSASVSAEVKRPYIVQDDIGVAFFGDKGTGTVRPINISPDGKLAAVVVERGDLDRDRPEDEVRVYRLSDLKAQIQRRDEAERQPLWVFNRSTYREGPIIQDIRWLVDSSGFAFLERGPLGVRHLALATIGSKSLRILTPEKQDVSSFDIRDGQTYVYAAFDLDAVQARARIQTKRSSIAATESDLRRLLLPADKYPELAVQRAGGAKIWFVKNGHPAPAIDPMTPGQLETNLSREMKLSPNGKFAVVHASISNVPNQWMNLFKTAQGDVLKLSPGKQGVHEREAAGILALGEYDLVDLESGKASSLTHMPSGFAALWFASSRLPWSSDGSAVVLASSFVPERGGSDPCVTVVRIATGAVSCVLSLGDMMKRENFVLDASFVDGRSDRLSVRFANRSGNPANGVMLFIETSPGTWTLAKAAPAETALEPLVTLAIKESPNERPVLWATDTQSNQSISIWDPNPKLDQIALGRVETLHLADESNHPLTAGLFYPPDYRDGTRYPLVIQSHGFSADQFRPSGIWPGPFVAQILAASGFLVLQVPDCGISNTPEEAPCDVHLYESAVAALTKRGMIDRDRIGIIGFSRTCYYVMETLTNSILPIAAASMQDGVMANYFQYVYNAGSGTDALQSVFDQLIGARPFGEGLKTWLEKSPLFNTDKIHAPLLSIAPSVNKLLEMWEPYALLQLQNKPTDLLVLKTLDHVMTNPSSRLASEGANVDWFRFWLQGYEDSSPDKADQYRRWEGLCDLQIAEKIGQPTFCVPTKH